MAARRISKRKQRRLERPRKMDLVGLSLLREPEARAERNAKERLAALKARRAGR
jgi:hypothetical protein